MKTRILALLLALFCILSFCACNAEGTPDETGAYESEEETTEEVIIINEDTLILAQEKQSE